MVTVAHIIDSSAGVDADVAVAALTQGLNEAESARVSAAFHWALEVYDDHQVANGESCFLHALGIATIVTSLMQNADTRIAALLFALPRYIDEGVEAIREQHGEAAAELVHGMRKLERLRPIIRRVRAEVPQPNGSDATNNTVAGNNQLFQVSHQVGQQGIDQSNNSSNASDVLTAERIPAEFNLTALDDPSELDQSSALLHAEVELLRKMLLAVIEDIRVVILRLASRTQTLRYCSGIKAPRRAEIARETLAIYSPLANRLGIWELKWELEDRSFRLLHPVVYSKIARQLDSTRLAREAFIHQAIAQLRVELDKLAISAEIYGRPKHIYSIWNKMRHKLLTFDQVYDVRAIRVIVQDVATCYVVLGVVHQLWQPIAKEFDDYIATPKANNYRSLHTVVFTDQGLSLEIQIRTDEMHRQAELGLAAHWRYKEGGQAQDRPYDDKIARLRQLAAWRDDDSSGSSVWTDHYKQAALNDTVYVMTPKGKVLDLPRGATAIDFAYRVHTNLGHRCRGAKIDKHLLPLQTPLETGQTVEIITHKSGGPSRDWLNPALGYIFTKSARNKVRQWFASHDSESYLIEGKQTLQKELHRLGKSSISIEKLAEQLAYPDSEALFLALAKNEVTLRQIQRVLLEVAPPIQINEEISLRAATKANALSSVRIVGVDGLQCQFAGCCHPAPPEPIGGFITRDRGISIHRLSCRNYHHMVAIQPERVIDAEWNTAVTAVFNCVVQVIAEDRQGLLRDISDVFTQQKISVISAQTQTRDRVARMSFTVEILHMSVLNAAIAKLNLVPGVNKVLRC